MIKIIFKHKKLLFKLQDFYGMEFMGNSVIVKYKTINGNKFELRTYTEDIDFFKCVMKLNDKMEWVKI